MYILGDDKLECIKTKSACGKQNTVLLLKKSAQKKCSFHFERKSDRDACYYFYWLESTLFLYEKNDTVNQK